jgi:hypothetical protein
MFETTIQGFPASLGAVYGDSDFSRARGARWFDARESVPYDEKSVVTSTWTLVVGRSPFFFDPKELGFANDDDGFAYAHSLP